jgi:CRP-like cAMP-binding protein
MKDLPNMPSHNDLDALAELRLVATFAEVASDALGELAPLATQRRLHAQLPLIEQGTVAKDLFVLVRGAAKLVRVAPAASGDAVVVLDVVRAPAVVGDASVIDGQPALASVITLRSSHVLAFARGPLSKLCSAHPSLSRALLARMAQEARAHVRRIDEVVAGSVDERVKRLFERLALQHGTALGQGRFIAIPLRRRDIACMVNATTETVSRLLAKFEREGLARSTRDGIWWRTAAKPDREQPPRPESDRPEPAPSVALPRDRRG